MPSILDRLRPRKAALNAPASATAISNTGDDEEQRYRPIEWWLIRKLLGAMKPHSARYMPGIAFACIHNALDLLDPMFMGTLINFCAAYIGATSPLNGVVMPVERLIRWIAPTPNPSAMTTREGVMHVGLIVRLWAASLTTSIIFNRLTILFMTRAGENVQFDYRKRMFAQLQSLSMSYFDKTKLGRIISRMTSDINGMREVNVWGVTHIVDSVVHDPLRRVHDDILGRLAALRRLSSG